MADLSTRLRNAGYEVYLPDYGRDETTVLGSVPTFNATGDIAESARELARYIDVVRATSGDYLVDLAGHSQRGLVARHYLGFEGGAGKVDSLITLGSPHHGTAMHGLGTAQDGDPGNLVEHTGLPRNRHVQDLVVRALDRRGVIITNT